MEEAETWLDSLAPTLKEALIQMALAGDSKEVRKQTGDGKILLSSLTGGNKQRMFGQTPGGGGTVTSSHQVRAAGLKWVGGRDQRWDPPGLVCS